MRDVKRIKKILGIIEEMWSKYPDLRFYQMLINYGLIKMNNRLWNLEDEDLLKFLTRDDKN